MLAAAIPATAQDQPESLLPPGFGEQSPAPAPTPALPGNTAAPTGGSETAVEIVPMDQALADLLPENVPPPVELPASARRDPEDVDGLIHLCAARRLLRFLAVRDGN